MLKVFPRLADVPIEYGWGGTLAITMNRMPDFGRIGEHLWYAQGFSGHGVPTATTGSRDAMARAAPASCPLSRSGST